MRYRAECFPDGLLLFATGHPFLMVFDDFGRDGLVFEAHGLILGLLRLRRQQAFELVGERVVAADHESKHAHAGFT